MEVTQFTYFQQVGGLECRPVAGEITYGLERVALYIQKVQSVYALGWARDPVTRREVSYGGRSEERRVGEDGVSKGKFRGWPDHSKKKNNKPSVHTTT